MIVTVTTRGKQRPRRFRGIVRAARELGVTREHLYHVIRGERQSPRLQAWLQHNLIAEKKA